jgi:FAD/FMN-containing dehydrogenase
MIGTSWGRLPRYRHTIVPLRSRFDALPSGNSLLAYGNGRSYGDVCLNENGTLIATRNLDRWIAFDPSSGVLECEAGVLLRDIIDFALPRGWLPAVCPGTALVTVGGAIANDVHGKNHHRLGTFGHHLLSFELERSDGARFVCSPSLNVPWFRATIGGLGLTGLIRSARLQLRRAASPWIAGDSQRFANLAGFFRLSAESEAPYEYTVSWIDCSATGAKLGRGVFSRGNHVQDAASSDPASGSERALRVPVTPPVSPMFGSSIRLFNNLVYHRPSAQRAAARWHFRKFLFPLDGVLEWNRLYGPRGFYQYQCVLPGDDAPAALTEMLERIARSGQGSFLSVLKIFGTMPSLGLLSFPRPGVTLALDFPNRGAPTLRLLEALDEITRRVGGAVYPAKDARMSARSFQQYFPAWREFQRYVDPHFSSSFWRRVTEHISCNES